MAWWDLAEATGEEDFREPYRAVLEYSLATYDDFLPGHPDYLSVMDRLHPFCYFLEGLLPLATEPCCARAITKGLQRVAYYLRDIAPRFERSDAYAQLLRMRVYADAAGVAPLDRQAAAEEAARLSEFQAASDDPRIAGGFYFGWRDGAWLPYVNPVSTVFGLQALALWETAGTSEGSAPVRHLLI
jgi:hypothetical protein